MLSIDDLDCEHKTHLVKICQCMRVSPRGSAAKELCRMALVLECCRLDVSTVEVELFCDVRPSP